MNGHDLAIGDVVLIPGHGTWTVLPLEDGCRWLGRQDGALLPLIPEDDYVLVGGLEALRRNFARRP